MSGKVFYAGLAGFCGGVFLASFWSDTSGWPVAGFLGLLGTAVLGFRIFQKSAESGRNAGSAAVLLAVVLLSAGLGVARMALVERTPSGELAAALERETTLEGIVVREPVFTESSQHLVVRVDSENDEPLAHPARVLVFAELRPRFSYGDRVSVAGALKPPEPFETDAGRVFDYPAYLARDNIFYTVSFPSVSLVASNEGNPVLEALFAAKRTFLASIQATIPEPHVALLGGLVVGAQESLGKKLLADFRTVGIIHIVVLSGYNVTIVAEALMRLFGFLGRRARLALGAVAIVLFAVLVGASATVVRASLMALLVVLARAFGRRYDITRALALAGLAMVLHNPLVLAFDPGFQLSFLATVGLIYLSPFVEQRLGFLPTKLGMREFAVATVATQLFVLPLLMYQTGQVSLAALPVNILVLGAVPLTMLAGFLAGAVGIASTLLALPFAYFSYGLLSYMLSVVEWFARLPFAAVSVPAIPPWAVALVYGAYALVLWRLWRQKTPAVDAAGGEAKERR